MNVKLKLKHMKKKTKYLYLYLVILKKGLPVLKGGKLVHTCVYKKESEALRNKKLDEDFMKTLTQSKYRFKILTFKIN